MNVFYNHSQFNEDLKLSEWKNEKIQNKFPQIKDIQKGNSVVNLQKNLERIPNLMLIIWLITTLIFLLAAFDKINLTKFV